MIESSACSQGSRSRNDLCFASWVKPDYATNLLDTLEQQESMDDNWNSLSTKGSDSSNSSAAQTRSRRFFIVPEWVVAMAERVFDEESLLPAAAWKATGHIRPIHKGRENTVEIETNVQTPAGGGASFPNTMTHAHPPSIAAISRQ